MAGVIDPLARQARLEPTRLAAIDLVDGARYSYAALDDLAARLAASLLARGFAPGDRLAALARNRVALIALHFACARIGAIYAPLNWRLAPAELAWMAADCAPRLIVGDGLLAQSGLSGERLEDLLREAARAEPASANGGLDPDRASLILYTSGTTGRPKGALISEANLEETARNFAALGQVTQASRFLIDAPMFHILGLVVNVRPALMQGGALLVSDGFEAGRTVARLGDRDLGATHYFCVPQMADALRAAPNFDPSRLRGLVGLFTGGAPHPAARVRAWVEEGVRAVDGYGMTETGTVFGMPLDPATIAAKAGAIGVRAAGVETRIVGLDGRDCGPDEPGELQVRGRSVIRGYWRQAEESLAAFAPGGWFRTGDIVSRDRDGFHTIHGRSTDMFISGGENVYPAEIEAALSDHPALAEVAVVGAQDARWGEVGWLFFTVRPGAEVAEEALLAWLGARLAKFKIPKRTVRLDALPRNAAGKVLRGALQALAARGGGPPA